MKSGNFDGAKNKRRIGARARLAETLNVREKENTKEAIIASFHKANPFSKPSDEDVDRIMAIGQSDIKRMKKELAILDSRIVSQEAARATMPKKYRGPK